MKRIDGMENAITSGCAYLNLAGIRLVPKKFWLAAHGEPGGRLHYHFYLERRELTFRRESISGEKNESAEETIRNSGSLTRL